MALLSVVVPCYNEEKALPFFYEEIIRISAALKEKYGLETEYWFVDDGSRDGTLASVKKLHAEDRRVHYVSFSRNFGKEAAIYAGLEAARGDYVTLMDADLQGSSGTVAGDV